ncbi:MAG TPA: tetratricopeptide repeat protein [Gemmatimonadaceae bacterium]|nr:tetratricopeptide repeat protein [Gemmatimonadaceae bacterium]
MTAPHDSDTLLADARARAASGDWEGVRALLGARADVVARRPDVALLLAESELRLGEPRAAIARLEGITGAFERGGDGASLRRALNLLGAAHFEVGELDAAAEGFGRALELASAEGDHLLVARATNNLGAIANIRGERERAIAHYQLAIPAYQRLGSVLGLAECHHNLAITFRDARRLDEADEHELRAMEFAREAGSARLRAMAQVGRAELCLLRGDARLADAGARRAAVEYAAIPDPVGEADALRLAGAARLAAGRSDDALAALDRAVALARAHASALIEAESLRTRAELWVARREPGRARADAEGALAIFDRLGAVEERAAAADLLARLDG